MKRLLAIILAACFVLGGAMSAFAANVTEESTDRFVGSYSGAFSSQTGGSPLTKLKRNRSAWLRFTVIDNGAKTTGEKADSAAKDDKTQQAGSDAATAADNTVETAPTEFDQKEYVDNVEITYDSSALPQNGEIVKSVSLNSNKQLCFNIAIPVTYSGTGNTCEFYLTYTDVKANAVQRVHVSQTVDICVPYDESKEEDDDDEDLKPLTPYIIVSNYSYGGGGSVTAGNEFNLSLTLRNTSSELDLDNIIASLSPMGVFSVASSSNTFYIESLPAGGETTITAKIKAGMTKVTDDDDANSINMSFRYQYTVDSTRNDGTSSESITIPVDYPDRFELGILEASDTAYLGDSYSIYLPMVNKGRSSVYNLTAAITCEGVKAAQSQYIGNLAAGTESGADFTLDFTESGEFAGKITVTYEDANMDEHTVEQDFSVNVMSYEEAFGGDTIDNTGDEIIDDGSAETETGMSTKTKLLIGGGVAAAAIIAGAVIHKKRKEKDAVEDEEI